MFFHARTVIEQKEVEDTFRRAKEKYPRLCDVWEEGWKWRLARDPEKDGVLVEGTKDKFLLRPPADYAAFGVPSMTILYSWTADEVVVYAVNLHVPL